MSTCLSARRRRLLLGTAAPLLLAGCDETVPPTAPAEAPAASEALLASTGPVELEPGVPFRIGAGIKPAVSGDRIVWEDDRNGNDDIFLFDLSTGSLRALDTDGADQTSPDIHGSLVVWRDERLGRGTPEAFVHDVTTGTGGLITVERETRQVIDLRISDRWIVWSDDRDLVDTDIFGYDLATGQERLLHRLDENQRVGDIDGSLVVYVVNGDIWLLDGDAGWARPLSQHPANQQQPVISGNRVVWKDFRNGTGDLYMYDLATQTESPLVTHPAEQDGPSIDGDRVVWRDRRDGGLTLYAYDFATGEEVRATPSENFATDPHISGDIVVYRSLEDGDVYAVALAPSATNSPPTLDLGGPYEGSEGSRVELAVHGTDPDGDPLTYTWELGDGTTGSGDAPPAAHTWADDGVFTLTVTVDDGNGGADQQRTTVSIANVAPSVSRPGNAQLIAGETYTGSGTFDDPGADDWTAAVDWGEGDGAERLSLTDHSWSLSHVYPAPGDFDGSVRVEDDDGGAGSAAFHVHVISVAEAIRALEQEVADLAAAGAIGLVSRGLRAGLRFAARLAEDGRVSAAAGILRGFIAVVNGLMAEGRIGEADAESLIAFAERIIVAMGGELVLEPDMPL